MLNAAMKTLELDSLNFAASHQIAMSSVLLNILSCAWHENPLLITRQSCKDNQNGLLSD